MSRYDTRVLIGILDHTRDLAKEMGFACNSARVLGLDVGLAGDHSWDLNRTLARAHARAFNLGVARDLHRDLDIARDLHRHLDVARDLAVELALGLSRKHPLAHNRDFTRALDRSISRDLYYNLNSAIAAIDGFIEHLLLAESRALPQGGSARSAVEMSPAAQWVTVLAVRLLPAGCRLVKAEELAAELYDIAAAGGPRRRQLAHALRVLATIVPLRRALADGGRRAAERV